MTQQQKGRPTGRNPFKPAATVQKKAKVLVYGEPGTGKTFFALSWPRVALVDTEGGADLYGGRFDFDVLRTKSFTEILDAIETVKADQGRTWQTLVIDPISIVWQVLQDAGQQAAEARAVRKGSAADDVLLTPRDWGVIKRRLYSAMTDLVNLPVNVIMTAHSRDMMEMRRDGRGQEVAVKVGEKPDAEKKAGYWPDVVIRLVVEQGKHVGIVEKDRSGLFKVGSRVPNISYTHFTALLSSHETGETVQQPSEADAAAHDAALLVSPAVTDYPIAAIHEACAVLGITEARLAETLARDYSASHLDELTPEQAAHLRSRLEKALSAHDERRLQELRERHTQAGLDATVQELRAFAAEATPEQQAHLADAEQHLVNAAASLGYAPTEDDAAPEQPPTEVTPTGNETPLAPPGRKVSRVSRYQREKLTELYKEVEGVDEGLVAAGLNGMFEKQFGHGLDDASYNEGAHITARLLALQRQRARQGA